MSREQKYYDDALYQLAPYEQLIECWARIFDRRRQPYVLDNVNYRADLFPDCLSVSEVMNLFQPEPGYFSPDGSMEAAGFARALEKSRMTKAGIAEDTAEEITSRAGIGFGNGCSNVACAACFNDLARAEIARSSAFF